MPWLKAGTGALRDLIFRTFAKREIVIKIVLVDALERQLPYVIEGSGNDLRQLGCIRLSGNPFLDLGYTRIFIGVLVITGLVFHNNLSDILLLKYYGLRLGNAGQFQGFYHTGIK